MRSRNLFNQAVVVLLAIAGGLALGRLALAVTVPNKYCDPWITHYCPGATICHPPGHCYISDYHMCTTPGGEHQVCSPANAGNPGPCTLASTCCEFQKYNGVCVTIKGTPLTPWCYDECD